MARRTKTDPPAPLLPAGPRCQTCKTLVEYVGETQAVGPAGPHVGVYLKIWWCRWCGTLHAWVPPVGGNDAEVRVNVPAAGPLADPAQTAEARRAADRAELERVFAAALGDDPDPAPVSPPPPRGRY